MVDVSPNYATSILSAPYDRLARLVAASDTYQAVVGAATAAEALASIHIPLAVDALEALDGDGNPINPMPRAIIDPVGGQLNFEKVGVDVWNHTNSAQLTFEFVVPASLVFDTTDVAGVTAETIFGKAIDRIEYECHNWFMQQIGDILKEMMALAGNGESVIGESHLAVKRISLTEGPISYSQEESEADEAGYIPYEWVVRFLVEWR